MREQTGCKRQRELTKERDIRTGKTKTDRIEKTRRNPETERMTEEREKEGQRGHQELRELTKQRGGTTAEAKDRENEWPEE